ncbi:hypothetical protein PLEOSDRAFT_1095851 [Pleurotus ostreatus PC15]|uniref:Caleosin-domain-containing protein n=2 Tax=Pleurotus TaxID=5320 RepID=A0A067NT24_PLEO1|nr:hypothetical protein CCMSSC00406_0006939 [Pleurotus cornucopiae]KDQ30160.1 hypothetical protein PLEOSDRAFT_1095851 [Pleurotus ostreatus PC15]
MPSKFKIQQTPLEKHTAFFDTDGDGIIWPLDTFAGCRAIGFNLLTAALSAIIIHSGLSWATMRFPDPLFRLRVDKMEKAMHGSDSTSYTAQGDFDETRFDHTFELYTQPPHTSMSFGEVITMLNGQRNAYDFFGSFAALFEWLAMYLLLWPADGLMKKEDIRAIYDGSLFYTLAQSQNASKSKNNE